MKNETTFPTDLGAELAGRAALRSQVKKTTGYVRRNPITGLGVAFATGLVVCALLFRR